MSRASIVTTRSGVQIGCAHVPRRPLHSITRSEETMQALLLREPRRIDWSGVLIAAVMAAAFAVVLFLGPWSM